MKKSVICLVLLLVFSFQNVFSQSGIDLKLPWRSGETWTCTSGYNGPATNGSIFHSDEYNAYYALDFDKPGLPENGPDQPILAAASGNVIFSGLNGGYGYTVKIDHGSGYVTMYSHLRYNPNISGYVFQGQQIGIMGGTGTDGNKVFNDHIHFQLYYQNGCKSYVPQSIPEPMSGYTNFTKGLSYISNNEKKTIAVTEPGYDNIQQVLDNMGSAYQYTNITNSDLANQSFDLNQFEILFINCSSKASTYAVNSANKLRDWVFNGGSLYASDWAYIYIKEAFPNNINFPVNPMIGSVQSVKANVEDDGLKAVLGSSIIDLNFNLSGWVVIDDVPSGTKVYLSGTYSTSESSSLSKLRNGLVNRQLLLSSPTGIKSGPLMVSFKYGQGNVIFTTFHNEPQATEQEKKLLEYLILRPIVQNLVNDAIASLPSGYEVDKEIVGATSPGGSQEYQLENDQSNDITVVLNWEGSELKLDTFKPNGSIYNSWQSSIPPIIANITNAELGIWQYKVTAIDVPYENYPFALVVGKEKSEKVATPIFSPLPGIFNSPITVSLSCSTPGAIIHFTIDGSTPTESSPIYSAPLNINATTLVKAKALKNEWTSSDVAIGVYNINSVSEPSELNVSSVIASADDGAGNVAENTIDNRIATRWSAGGDGQWITYDLGSEHTVAYLKIAWYKGDERIYYLDIEVSNDNSNWTQVYTGQSSGATLDFEMVDFNDIDARYVKIIGHKNSYNNWTSINEVDIYGYPITGAITKPTNVAATDGIYTDKVQVSWNSVSGATDYQVYRNTTNSTIGVTSISSWQTSLSYADETAIPGKTYYYFVKAATSSTGSNSSGFSASADGWRKLSPPTGLTASNGTAEYEIEIDWNSSPGATHYLAYRNTINDPNSAEPVKDADANPYWTTGTGLYDDYYTYNGVIYYYWVRAAMSNSEYRMSDFSNFDIGWLKEPPATDASELGISTVNASADDGAGNVAENTIDNRIATRWSAGGDGQWILYNLDSKNTVAYLTIAWYKGDERIYYFDIEVSNDSSNWTQVYTGQSSGTTLEQELVDFLDNDARYVQIIGHKNSYHNWTSINEVDIYGYPIINTITITEPKNTTKWTQGDQNVSINWQTGNLGGNIKIELYKGSNNVAAITNSTSNDGIYNVWDVPSSLVSGSDYRVLITSLSNTSTFDYSDYFEVTVTPSTPPIIPVAPPQSAPDSEFWVNIDVGSISIPVSDLKVVSFELLYTNTSIIDYDSYQVGNFLTGAQATVIPDDPNGKVSVSVYRTTGGDSGYGTVIQLKFKVLNSALTGQKIDWSFAGVQANNSSGVVITLDPQVSSTEIAGLLVWPGDANNNGVVNIFDINSVVAIHWNKTGPIRPNASTQWIGQPCPPWNPPEATYADCNGSGKVDIFDINSVIINFGKTHSSSSMQLASLGKTGGVTSPPITVEARDYNETTQEFWLDVSVGDASLPLTDLKVVSFELTYTNTANVDYDSYQIGGFLTGAQATVIPDDANGKVSASVYLLSGGKSGHGIVVSFKFKADKNHTIDFNFSGVQANNSGGGTIQLSPAAKTVVTSVGKYLNEQPKDYVLFPNYPNPFNPETTISYSIPRAGNVLLQIFNLNGRLVRTIVVNEFQDAGVYSVSWNAKDQTNRVVSSGIYITKLTIGDVVLRNKLIFSK